MGKQALVQSVCQRMDAACASIKVVLDLGRYGGRLLRRDNNTAIVYDYDFLPQRSIDLICTQFPQLQVSIHAADSSAAGFIIVFVYEVRPLVVFSEYGFQLVVWMLLLTVCVWLPYTHISHMDKTS
jgi:hypothetical protein